MAAKSSSSPRQMVVLPRKKWFDEGCNKSGKLQNERFIMSQPFTCPHCGETSETEKNLLDGLESCSVCGEPVTVPGARKCVVAKAGDWFQFSLINLLGYLAVGCVLLTGFTLLIGKVLDAREAARRNSCIGNLKNLGLSVHNHFDIHNRLPLASSRPRSAQPGAAQLPDPAGYGWTVALLPFMEELFLFEKFRRANRGFHRGAFEIESQPQHGCQVLSFLKCPTDSGSDYVDNSQSEYQSYATPQGNGSLGRSNYVAFAASHFKNEQGSGDLYDPVNSNGLVGNGMFPLPSSPSNLNHGISFKATTDGISQTVMLCETREAAYAAWIDGQATWVVGAWQGASQVPGEEGAADGMLGWPDDDTTSRAVLGLNPLDHPSEVYLSAKRYGAGHDRRWGPSSEHAGGVVNHAFADGHVVSLSPGIDRNLYLRIISRNGGETVPLN